MKRENLSSNSAGLVLGLSSLIDDKELVNSKNIAITGTLEKNGDVREVGAVKEKVRIAVDYGLSYFVLPEENKAEAEEIKQLEGLNITIIPVTNIDEAINEIKKLNNLTKLDTTLNPKTFLS